MSQAPYQLLITKEDAADERQPIPHREVQRVGTRRAYRLLAFAAATALGFLGGTHYQSRLARDVVLQESSLDKCPSHLPLLASPPAAANPWAPLSRAEIQDIKTWLFDSRPNLNLTEGRAAKISDNVVFHVESYPPSKDDALAFIDAPGNQTRSPPGRYARVTIDHGGLSVPVTRDYIVGPLPTSKETSIRRLTEIYHQEDIPFNARGLLDVADLTNIFGRAMAPMADAIEDLFGGRIDGDPSSDSFIGGMSGGWSFDGSLRRTWISWKFNSPGSWIQPTNLYSYIDMSGSDPSLWKILKVVYHNQTFASVPAFLEAYKTGTLIRFPRPTFSDSTWASRRRTGTPRDLDHLPGPRSVSFAGPRFRVNREQGYISWLGWGMYLSFDRDMGLSLWDIRFRGERIIYQLQPQDCLVQYSGHDPVQSTTSWLDRYFGMGLQTRDLLPHYDCPQEAVYLPSTLYHPLLGVIERRRAVCIFELDTGRPLTRHFGEMPGETGAVKGYVLTVRSIASLGNYDYLFDYIFHLDGTVEVKVSASGYLQGGYWDAEQEGYGSPIHLHSMGNVHDHVINFKADSDADG